MPQTFRDAKCYRSMLFVPGHKLDWMLKAPKYGSDALILDLEDSVGVAEKPAARNAVAEAIKALRDRPVGLFVRLNGWRTGYLIDDLSAVVDKGLDGVMLSKTEDPEDVTALDLVLGELERSRGLPLGRIEICPYPESAVAMYRLYDICMASQRVKRAGAATGPNPRGDGGRSLGLQYDDEEAVEGVAFGAYSVLQARAAGIVHIEGAMCGQLGDLDLVRRLGKKSKRMGASFGSAIHPSHIPIINEIYSPSQEEVDEARGVVSALAEGIARGDAAVRYKSKLIDFANARAAMDVLKKAEAAGMDIGDVPKLEIPAY
ncbi:citrate lyase subunit beta / citryl-CoA lyase [Bradyrhizobium shewense]|uniref:Citrate lyase subunit beta / citryl-CoA lyase n=2 Tax=Bradyrhizobium shewense TaxID=1761772 RepID=A0A1C3XUP6_9BRAD|nr:citrate lyase subunit beta / citryl-CoA lyase [Bradyrhizobium shewense]